MIIMPLDDIQSGQPSQDPASAHWFTDKGDTYELVTTTTDHQNTPQIRTALVLICLSS